MNRDAKMIDIISIVSSRKQLLRIQQTPAKFVCARAVHYLVHLSALKTSEHAWRNKLKIPVTVIDGSQPHPISVVVHATRPKVKENEATAADHHHLYLSSIVESKCRVEIMPDEYIRGGDCISLSRVGREHCAGGCESQASNVLTVANISYQLGNSTCECCAPKDTYTENVSMECKRIGVDAFVVSATYTRIRSCSCQVCKG